MALVFPHKISQFVFQFNNTGFRGLSDYVLARSFSQALHQLESLSRKKDKWTPR